MPRASDVVVVFDATGRVPAVYDLRWVPWLRGDHARDVTPPGGSSRHR